MSRPQVATCCHGSVTEPAARGAVTLLRRAPGFRALWTARGVSFLGDSVGLVALLLYVADTVGTGAAVALLMLVGEVGPALLSPLAGTVADRFDLRRLMIGCELGQGLVMAVIAWRLPSLPVLLTLVAVRTTLAQLFAPAGRAALPRLVDDGELEAANAAIGVGTHGLDAGGPLVAAALLPWLGVRGVLAVDAVTFVLSAAVLLRLPRLPSERTAADRSTGVWGETRAGLAVLLGHRRLRLVATAFWLGVLATGLDDVVLVFLGKGPLHTGDAGVSLLYAGVGIGLLFGFTALAGRHRIRRAAGAAGVALAGMAIAGAGNLLTGLAPVLAVAVGMQALRGAGLSLVEVGVNATVARSVPRAVLGRVFATLYGGVSVAAASSYLLGGLLLGVLSPRAVLVLAGTVAIGVTASCAVLLRRTE